MEGIYGNKPACGAEKNKANSNPIQGDAAKLIYDNEAATLNVLFQQN